MPRTLCELSYGKRYISLVLSKDWLTREPWTHQGAKIPYVCKKRVWSVDSKIYIDHWYLGPVAVLYGKWVG